MPIHKNMTLQSPPLVICDKTTIEYILLKIIQHKAAQSKHLN